MTHEYPSLHLQAGVSVPGFLTYDKQKQAFASAAVQTGWAPTLTGHGDPVRLQAGHRGRRLLRHLRRAADPRAGAPAR